MVIFLIVFSYTALCDTYAIKRAYLTFLFCLLIISAFTQLLFCFEICIDDEELS